jgi:arylsulfatase
MKDLGASEALRKAFGSWIVEAKGPGETKKVRAYTREYRKQIEGDIAKASVSYIKKQAKAGEPFFLMIGWTRPHFPNDTSEEFKSKSGVGRYGDSVVELDYRTGEVLGAIRDAGIEENTIVIWVSDNGPTITATALDETHAGDAGPFRGELGGPYEGSIRTAGMIKWPGKIAPNVSNEMFSIHDFLPTLANLIGAKVPNDRPIDGVDQSAFLLGKQENSNRDHLLTFIKDRLAAVRWNQFRIYPIEVVGSDTSPELKGYMGVMHETAGFPAIYNIEADPKERVNIAHTGAGWVMGPYLTLVEQYKRSLVKFPNPPVPSVTDFR